MTRFYTLKRQKIQHLLVNDTMTERRNEANPGRKEGQARVGDKVEEEHADIVDHRG